MALLTTLSLLSCKGVRAVSCDWKGDGFVVGTNKCDVRSHDATCSALFLCESLWKNV